MVTNVEVNKVYDWVAKHALFSPAKTAIVDLAAERCITYAEFNALANCVANLLEAVRIKAGDRVAIIAPSSAEILLTLFGCTKVGAIFVPVNHKLPAAELLPMIENCEPRVLIYADEFSSTAVELYRKFAFETRIKLSGEAHDCELDWTQSLQAQSPVRNVPIPVDQNAPQMLLYTSGTSGRPKGVVLPHRMQFFNAINFATRDLNGNDRVLVHTPMFYTGGLNVYTTPAIFLGGTVVIMKQWNADEVLRVIARERITAFFAVPTQFQMMVDSPLWQTSDLSSLRWVISGGAPCPLPLIRKLVERGLRFKQGFGMTEVGVNCFCLEAEDAERKIGSIGFPNFLMEARVVGEDGSDVPTNTPGELILRTPAMCDGYWNNPKLTGESIRDGWFYTGDIAQLDEDGYCYVVDRKKDMFISGGENVYPGQIEKLLQQHPKVKEVAIVGVADAKWGEVGAAAIVLRNPETGDAAEFTSFLQGKIAKFKIPRFFYFVDSLPRTVSQKVHKQELRTLLGGATSVTATK